MAAGLAVALAREGMPFRKAHAVVGAIVAEAQRDGTSVREAAGRTLPAHSPAVAARLEALFDPTEAIRAKAARGGTAPEAVRASLDAALARVRAATRPSCLGTPWRAWLATSRRATRCPRLRRWCQEVARVRVKRFSDQEYWGRPVPGFGDPKARLLVVGLAPAAHGANRTGRVFTGDRSGDFLFAALHRAGYANQPSSVSRDDGLRLDDCYVAALARCAPPANKPTPEELTRCRSYIDREWRLLPGSGPCWPSGRSPWTASWPCSGRTAGSPRARPWPSATVSAHDLGDGLVLFTSYHPSQQNTFTGKLTPAGFDAVLRRVGRHLGRPVPSRNLP